MQLLKHVFKQLARFNQLAFINPLSSMHCEIAKRPNSSNLAIGVSQAIGVRTESGFYV